MHAVLSQPMFSTRCLSHCLYLLKGADASILLFKSHFTVKVRFVMMQVLVERRATP